MPDALPGGRRLLLSSDFYAVYQSLGRVDGVDNLWCWSHIRRYFVRAGDAHRDLQAWTPAWLERIGALYRAHSALAAAPTGSPQQAQAAAQFAATLKVIDTERTAQAANAHLMHPAAVKVLATLDREWDGLARHREFPELPLDNNASERALRGPVVGRKNFYGSGSIASAELASRVWTITATAERAGLNPLVYLGAYLDDCAQAGGTAPTGTALNRFLPWALSTDDHAAWARDPRPQPDTDPRAIRAPGRHLNARPTGTVVWTTNGTSSPPERSGHPPADDHRRAHRAARALTQGSRRDSSADGITECLRSNTISRPWLTAPDLCPARLPAVARTCSRAAAPSPGFP